MRHYPTKILVTCILLLLIISVAAFHNVPAPRQKLSTIPVVGELDQLSHQLQKQSEIQNESLARIADRQDKHLLALAKAGRGRVKIKLRPFHAPSNVGGGLACIGQKESGGNYNADGFYKGKYQYQDSTWNHYGGYKDANDAPPEVQDRRAQEDYNKGHAQIHQNWPNTSNMCGV